MFIAPITKPVYGRPSAFGPFTKWSPEKDTMTSYTEYSMQVPDLVHRVFNAGPRPRTQSIQCRSQTSYTEYSMQVPDLVHRVFNAGSRPRTQSIQCRFQTLDWAPERQRQTCGLPAAACRRIVENYVKTDQHGIVTMVSSKDKMGQF